MLMDANKKSSCFCQRSKRSFLRGMPRLIAAQNKPGSKGFKIKLQNKKAALINLVSYLIVFGRPPNNFHIIL